MNIAAAITQIIKQIDTQIATRPSNHFGIKMGNALYRELFDSGHITIEKFGAAGTNLFVQDVAAYKKTYGVCMDPYMSEYHFEVGVP